MSRVVMQEYAPTIPVQAASTASFRPFGKVIEMGGPAITVNNGTALRHDVDSFAGPAPTTFRLVTSIYDAKDRDLGEPISMLERHPNTAQMIAPLGGEGHLVIVCENASDGRPQLSTLTAFRFSAPQGATYRPGLWRHPIFSLGRQTQFPVQYWQNGAEADCETARFMKRTIATDDVQLEESQ